MLSVGPKRRKLTVIHQRELFSCEPLACRISYAQCALRHIKGEALVRGEAYAWVPEQWAKYATPCRGCALGAKHAVALGVRVPKKPGPNKPPAPTPFGRSKAAEGPGTPYRTCEGPSCGRLHRALHALCSRCRKAKRSPRIG